MIRDIVFITYKWIFYALIYFHLTPVKRRNSWSDNVFPTMSPAHTKR
jgi:hypothetical protein